MSRQIELNAQLDLENSKNVDADLGGLDEEATVTRSMGVAEYETPYQTDNKVR